MVGDRSDEWVNEGERGRPEENEDYAECDWEIPVKSTTELIIRVSAWYDVTVCITSHLWQPYHQKTILSQEIYRSITL